MKTSHNVASSKPAWRSNTHTPARRVVAPTGGIVRGKFPSVKAGRMVAFESLLERDALLLFDFSESVLDIHEQPATLTFPDGTRTRRYTPDFEIVMENGHTITFEVKPAFKLDRPKVAHVLALVQQRMQAVDLDFRILTNKQIRIQPQLRNLKLLHRYLRYPLPEPLLAAFSQSPKAMCLGWWALHLGGLHFGLAAIAQGKLDFDFDSELNLSTLIWPRQEGDRHVRDFI